MSPHSVTEKSVRALHPSYRYARTHSKKQIEQIAGSIRRFGWTYPILIDERNCIVCGVGRWQAAAQLNLAKVPVIVLCGLSDAEKRALMLADNKIASNAGWDRKILAQELGDLSTLLPEINLDISITGFEPAEIDALAVDFSENDWDPADEIPAPDKEAISNGGDLWILGDHRLLCGNSCSEDDFRRLMNGGRGSMVFADTPYNLPVSGIVGRGKIKHRDFHAASGEMSPAQFIEFLTQWMALASQYAADGALNYVCIDWRHVGEVLAAGKNIFSELKNIVVWVKTNAGQGSFYRSQHELVLVFKNGKARHTNNVELGKHGRNRTNVWTYPGVNAFRAGRLDELSLHPTVKPIALVADAMRDCSRRGEIILDPFMGSGTTILAAERVGRRGYGMEIDPLYVDVAVRRWQSFTGRDAILEATGRTFDDIMEHGRNQKHKIWGSK